MGQKFYAHPTDTFTWPNGAIGHRDGSPFGGLGPYAKVQNCPIHGTDQRLTCYATAYPDTYWTVPACTQKRHKHVPGHFELSDGGITFHVAPSHQHLFDIKEPA